MDNTAMIFEQYLKDLKLSASEDYIYVVRDDFFGDIVFSVSSSTLNMMTCNGLPDKYFGKMICADYIRQKTIGFETSIGIIDSNNFITQYECSEKFRRAMRIFNGLKADIISSDVVRQICHLNDEQSDFYNNILLRKADDGAGRYIFEDKVMYVAPCMLPGSKSTSLEMIGYYKTGNDYYIASFITHKKTGDVTTLMRFLCL